MGHVMLAATWIMNTTTISAPYARKGTHGKFVKPQAHTQMPSILPPMASAKFVVTVEDHFLVLSMSFRKFYDHASICRTLLFLSDLRYQVQLQLPAFETCDRLSLGSKGIAGTDIGRWERMLFRHAALLRAMPVG